MSSHSSSTDYADDDDDDDEEEEDETYSLRVRLLSAVDLPPSLSPNVPHCPWFELGLADGGEEDEDQADRQTPRSGTKKDLHPKWEEEEKEEGGDSEPHKKAGENESEASKLLRKLPPSSIRTSAFKIMTKVRVCVDG